MAEVLQIPPVLSEVIAAMTSALTARANTTPVSSRVDEDRPDEFIRAMVIASNRLSVAHADTAVLFECWSTDEIKAENLGALAYALATSLVLPSGAYCPVGPRGTIAAPYPLHDDLTGTPRSLFTVRYITPVESI